MNQSEISPEATESTAAEEIEALLIAFVINHTRTFEDAAPYLNMKVGALRERREKYRIPDPPPHHYDCPVLSQREMARAFLASLAAAPVPMPATLEVVARSVNVTLAPPSGPIVTVPLSAVLPRRPEA